MVKIELKQYDESPWPGNLLAAKPYLVRNRRNGATFVIIRARSEFLHFGDNRIMWSMDEDAVRKDYQFIRELSAQDVVSFTG